MVDSTRRQLTEVNGVGVILPRHFGFLTLLGTHTRQPAA